MRIPVITYIGQVPVSKEVVRKKIPSNRFWVVQGLCKIAHSKELYRQQQQQQKGRRDATAGGGCSASRRGSGQNQKENQGFSDYYD